jgi:hypothetical protein
MDEQKQNHLDLLKKFSKVVDRITPEEENQMDEDQKMNIQYIREKLKDNESEQ